ncbi:tellurite resistance TerB family protein [Thalassolituus sp. C2-1]|uniref:tellurite resistance TerB family protein n=1 Tax=Venatorbacter sp. C2-1 TaxID=2597518 RepID=UPI001197603C|nr:tellurite resistance TerB family protein [Thalassolituus sp. C2-1]TVV41989.1 tellurite resistance TerB family protein [Thalassolituus sp. C2-1]
MDIKGLVNLFLSSATDLARQGRQGAEKALNIPAEGDARSDTLSTLAKGALGGGALSLLLGSKSGRKLGSTALKVGGSAALAAVAFKTYQSWKAGKNAAATGSDHDAAIQTPAALPEQADISAPALNERESLLLLSAMIAAAKADGHIDDAEQQRISNAVQAMGATADVNRFVEQELRKPLDPAEIAAQVKTPEEAAEVYLASVLIVDEQNFMEKAYLQELARQLKLEPGLVAELEKQVQQAG